MLQCEISSTASKASLLKSLTLLFVSTLADRYGLLENDWQWLIATCYWVLCSSLKDSFETWEISNYLTLVPRNRPLSIPQMSMLSLNNFLNKDGAAHYEIFTTQFSCSASDFGKIHNYMIIHSVIHFGVLWEAEFLSQWNVKCVSRWYKTCFLGILERFLRQFLFSVGIGVFPKAKITENLEWMGGGTEN